MKERTRSSLPYLEYWSYYTKRPEWHGIRLKPWTRVREERSLPGRAHPKIYRYSEQVQFDQDGQSQDIGKKLSCYQAIECKKYG